jgi:hypothetical protein
MKDEERETNYRTRSAPLKEQSDYIESRSYGKMIQNSYYFIFSIEPKNKIKIDKIP